MENKKRFKYAANSYVVTVAVIVIILLLNIISARHFGRIDFTEGNQFSISDDSKRIVAELEDQITIKAFFTKDLPPNMSRIRDYTEAMLEEYKAFSKGNVVFRFLDPSENEQYAEEATKIGIPEARLNVTNEDKVEIQNIFLGLGIFYRDKNAIIPVVNLDTLEYDLTSAIKRVTAAEIKTVGFLSGHEERTLETITGAPGEFSRVSRALEQNYKVTSVTIAEGKPIENIDTLIIAGPKKDLSEQELYAIDQFMIKGGVVIFMEDEYAVDNNLNITNLSTSLGRLYEKYGVSVPDQMVVDTVSRVNASFQQGPFSFFVTPYAFWIQVVKQFTDTAHPVLANLEGMVFPWTSPIMIEKKEGVEVDVLASTSDAGWLITGQPNLDPAQNFAVSPDQLKSYPLAVIVKTKLSSAFEAVPGPDASVKSDATVSVDSSGTSVSNSSPLSLTEGAQTQGYVKESEAEGIFVLMGNSAMATDMFVSQFEPNGAFFLNLVDFVTLDPSLIHIRSKGVVNRPLKELSAGQKTLVKFIGVAGMPLVVIALGILRNLGRKRRKKMTVAL